MNAVTFEELKVWQDSRQLVKSIYELSSTVGFKKDFGLRDQIQRAAVSIMNNISEGFERNNNKEFINFLGYSKGSAGEVRSMLYIALDLNYISEEIFNKNYEAVKNVSTQIANFKKYLSKHIIKENITKIRSFILSLINFSS